MHTTARSQFIVLLLLSFFLVACGESEQASSESDEPTPDNTQEVIDYYAARPEFFSFKTLADIPADLEWQNGSHLPDIGSKNAIKGGTEYTQIQDFPRTLRPVGPDSNGSFRPWIVDYTTLGLANQHPDGTELYPALAESWAVDAENKTVYAKINPDARWSDGEAITVEDYFFMFFLYQSDYIVAPWYKNWYSTQYVNITQYDDLTLSITLPQAKPDMDSRALGLRPMPRHFYKELGEDFVERYQWRFQPTTGPYVIKEGDVRKGQSITMTRLKDWWAKDNKFWRNRFNLDRVVINVIRDTAKAFEAFKKGDIDQSRLNLAEFWYDKLPNEDSDVASGFIQKTVFYNQTPRPTYGLWLNTSKALLDDKNVRIGINHATNWELVIERFFRGDYARLQTSSDGYDEYSHPTLKARKYDIDKALEHFALAGFTQRDENGVLINAAGDKLAFTLSTGYTTMQDVITILKEEAIKAGLEFRVEILDGTSGWKKVQEKQHDIHFAALSVSGTSPSFWQTFHSENAYEVAFLEDGSVNPDRKLKTQTNNMESMAVYEMDKMIDLYRASSDEQEMIDLAHKMTQLHHDHASFVPGFYQPNYRTGHWRWLRYPEFFNHKSSRLGREYHVHWIDEEMRKETLDAQKSGNSFAPEIKVFDQFK